MSDTQPRQVETSQDRGTTPPGECRLEWLTTAEAIASLQSEWDTLFASSGQQNVFLSWAFQATWYEFYGHLGEPLCATVRDAAGTLVGIAPLFRGCKGAGPLSKGTVSFSGPDERSPRSYYPEFVTAPGHARQVCTLVLRDLASQSPAMPLAQLRQVDLASPFWQTLLQAAAEEGYRCLIKPASSVVRGYLGETYEQYVQAQSSPSTRHLLRNYGRKFLTHHGSVEFRLCEDASQVASYTQEVIDLNVRRLASSGGASKFTEPGREEFVHRLAERLWQRGCLRLLSVRVNGETAAACLGTLEGQWFSAIHYGMNPAFEKERPGVAVIAHSIRTAMEAGARYFDLLPGEHSYKRMYLPTVSRLVTVTLIRSRRGALSAAAGLLVRR